MKYTLISRRSRHFAGVRNLRRGANYEGYVANEVETEQLITIVGSLLSPPRSSSLILHRGSIPLFWSHTNIFAPNPDVQLEPMDDDISPCNKHFQRLFRSYGSTCVVLSLIKQSQAQREILLGNAYRESCDFLNEIFRQYDPLLITNSSDNGGQDSNISQEIPSHIVYAEYDMLQDTSHEATYKGSGMILRLQQMSQQHITLTGFFTQALGRDILEIPDDRVRSRPRSDYEMFSLSRFCSAMFQSNTNYETTTDNDEDGYNSDVSDEFDEMDQDKKIALDLLTMSESSASESNKEDPQTFVAARFNSFVHKWYENLNIPNPRGSSDKFPGNES